MATQSPVPASLLGSASSSPGSPTGSPGSAVSSAPIDFVPPSGGTDSQTTHVYVATLFPVGASNAGGYAVVAVTSGGLTVDVTAGGLTPLAGHPQQIADTPVGLIDEFPPINAPTSGSIPVEGPPLLSLSISDGPQPGDLFDTSRFPHADEFGNESYLHTFNVPVGSPLIHLASLEGKEIVIHGTVEGDVYDPRVPVAVGFLHEITPHFLFAVGTAEPVAASSPAASSSANTSSVATGVMTVSPTSLTALDQSSHPSADGLIG